MGRGESMGRVSLWVVVLVAMGMMQSGMTQPMNLADSIAALDNCDFHFKGHRSVPPILNLQNPGLNALSSSIVARDGKAVVAGTTGKQCVFPGADGGDETAETAAVCAKHFHMELDKIATTALENVTDSYIMDIKGRNVVLPLTAVTLVDGTQLREGDGNLRYPESRRCVAFFTSSDITTILDKMLNKAHRKKLSKISVSAQRLRDDFNSLLTSILQFP